MSGNRLSALAVIIVMTLAACSAPAPVLVSTPTGAPATSALVTATAAATPAATAAPGGTPAAPAFAHTACAHGADLTGQTVYLYHLVDASSQQDEFVTPLKDGFEDAAAYFNAHGGVCGAQLAQVFPDSNKSYDTQTEFNRLAGLQPKPVMIALYGSGDAELLRDQLAQDQIPALGIRVGSVLGLYGADGQTPGWIFSTSPLYPDQFGAFCQFVAQHPQRYPRPVIGYLSWDGSFGAGAYTPEAIRYCAALGVKVIDPPVYFSDTDTYIHPHVQTLIDAGANILYTNSLGTGPAQIAKTLVEMGLQDKIALAAVNWGLDTTVGRLGQAALGAGGLPATNGLLGSLPLRSWAEADQPGIQLIVDQADLRQRPQVARNNFYLLAWASTDLYLELYIQTGNRVGFDHISGAALKQTLENIVYAPLGGLETINYQAGARRAPAADRIGQMAYLGRDGKTIAGPGNPLLLVSENGQPVPVPLLLPLSEFAPAPDLRPGGVDVPGQAVSATAPVISTGQIVYTAGAQNDPDPKLEIYSMQADGSGQRRLTNNQASDSQPAFSPDGKHIAFVTTRDGNPEIYVMAADGSAQTRLTQNPAADETPAWSPDGQKIAFTSDRDGNPEIYVMNSDGTGQTRLTHDPAEDGGPSWSPSGQQIAFLSRRAGNDDIFVMNADGSHPENLTHDPVDDGGPAWSPDGQKIVFDTNRNHGQYDIYVMNADGSGQTRLTDNPADDYWAAWSPDGTAIAFTSQRDGHPEVYVMNADGSGQTRRTKSLNGAFGPRWAAAR